jgi:cytochrome c5
MNLRHLTVAFLALSVAFKPVLTTLHAQTKNAAQAPVYSGSKAKKPHSTEDDGQRVFEQNCSRCHAAPEGFSPRISGTIIRHMRVRANLSKEDEQKLLHFLNP